MKDRAMQTLYKFALEPITEITADPNSYGFRAKRCVQDAIEQCFTCLNKANPLNGCWRETLKAVLITSVTNGY